MDENYFKRIMATIILIALIILAFFLLKPVLLSIIIGLILAFMFSPIYNLLYKIIKSKDLSAGIVCLLLLLIIFIPLWLLTPILVNQSIKMYMVSQQMDFITPLKKIFPSLFASQEFSAEIGSIIHSFVTKITNSFMNAVSNLILNFPTLFLQLMVVFFTLYFTLRDKEAFADYIKSLLPFSKDVETKIFEYSKGITSSVIYGQIVVGIIQGIIIGIGFFIFNVPNSLLLTLLATLSGVFPVIGTYIVWIPVLIYLLIAGNSFSAFGIIIFGLISSNIDNFLKPMIISRRAKIHSSIILIGMVGGLLLFGVLGLILGPLILAYLLIVLEIYRKREFPNVFVQPSQNTS